MNWNYIINLLPQNIRENTKAALQQALQTVDPSSIKTRDDALRVINQLKTQGLPSGIFDRVTQCISSPLATPILGALGLDKQEFKNGLQSLNQLDTPSALTNRSLLQGIDQLK